MSCRSLRRKAAALGVVLTLAAAGCSAQADHEQAGVSSDAAAARSAAAEKARHAYVDPCSLLTKQERTIVAGSYAGSKLSVRFDPSGVEFNSCTVPYRGSSLGALIMNYGYATQKVRGFARFIRDEKQDDHTKVKRVPGVGDEAWLLVDSSTREAWVRAGDHVMFVWTVDPSFDVALAGQMLEAMLERATPGMFEHPVHLPKACPPPTNSLVVKALGGENVTRAVGVHREKSIACEYASKRRTLSLTADPKRVREVADQLKVGRSLEGGLVDEAEEFRLAPESLTRLTPSDVGPYAFTYLLRPAAQVSASLGETARFGRYGGYPDYDQVAFRTIIEKWTKEQIARLRSK